MQEITKLLEKGDFEQAEKLCHKAIKNQGENPSLYKLLAYSYKGQGRIENLINCLQKSALLSEEVFDWELYFLEKFEQCDDYSVYEERLNKIKSNHYKKRIRELLLAENVITKSVQMHFKKRGLEWLKDNLKSLDSFINIEKDFKKRAEQFVEYLFDDSNRYFGLENPLHRPSYMSYPGLSENMIWPDDMVVQINADDFNFIKSEIINLIKTHDTKPYVSSGLIAPKGLEHLSGNNDWSSLIVVQGGKTKIESANRLIKKISDIYDLADFPPMAPEVMISILRPGTHITPHYGITNIKQTLHLGISVPHGDLGLKVGTRKALWREGHAILFDDSFEHEAWNFTDEIRIVLICDVWHPDLSNREKIFIRDAIKVIDEWRKSIFLD